MSFPNIIAGNEGEQFVSYTDQRWPIGQLMTLSDGRRYRFGRNGAGAATPGLLFQSEVPDANFDTLAVPTSALNVAGSRSVRVTLPANSIVINLWAEGYLVVEAAAGVGYGRAYKIVSHPASAGSEDITIVIQSPLKTALNTSDKLTFMKHPGADLIIHPAPPTAAVYGVVAGTIAAASYGWFACNGPQPVLVVGTHVIGGALSPTGTVTGSPDGSVEASGVLITTTNPTIAQETEIIKIGICMEVAPTTAYGMALLHMA